MPGRANTMLGNQQNSFRCLTEETTAKGREKVLDVASFPFQAGEVVLYDPVWGGVRRASGVEVPSYQFGVAYNTHITGLDECEGSGEVTYLWGPHEGMTTRITGETFVAGQMLYVASVTTSAGAFSNSGTAGKAVGFIKSVDGSWVRYQWTGQAHTG